jgi:hypothetical protein
MSSRWNPGARAPSPLRNRLKPLALIGVAALALHAAALGGLQWTWPQRSEAAPVAAMQVRVVMAQAPLPIDVALATSVTSEKTSTTSAVPAAVTPMASVVALALQPADMPRARPVARLAKAVPPAVPPAKPFRAPAEVAEPAAPTKAAELAAPAAPAVAIPAVLQVAQVAPPAHDSAAGDEPIPHYRTQVPPAVLLRYDLQRGGLHGSGDLLWRPDGDRYELRLDGRVGPLTVLTQVSSGGFDAAGLAPLRFTDKRLRRPESAANFQREAGKITFSGPATEFALHAGMQDRLSWMLQLAAIVAAEPTLRHSGAKVLMGVVGAHADASVWVFRCVGREAVETGAGVVDSIRYVREPRDPYDTTVQVWLDPQHHFLPVHATQKAGPNDEGFSLRLQALAAPP